MTEVEDLFDGDGCQQKCRPEAHAYAKLAAYALFETSPLAALPLLTSPVDVIKLGVNVTVMMEAARQAPEWFQAVVQKMYAEMPANAVQLFHESVREFIAGHPVAAVSEAVPE